MQGYEHLPYFHCATPENQSVGGMSDAVKITDSNAVFVTSNLLNRQGKEYYSKMLDGKGHSRVFNYTGRPIDDVAANDLKASRIQKKGRTPNSPRDRKKEQTDQEMQGPTEGDQQASNLGGR